MSTLFSFCYQGWGGGVVLSFIFQGIQRYDSETLKSWTLNNMLHNISCKTHQSKVRDSDWLFLLPIHESDLSTELLSFWKRYQRHGPQQHKSCRQEKWGGESEDHNLACLFFDVKHHWFQAKRTKLWAHTALFWQYSCKCTETMEAGRLTRGFLKHFYQQSAASRPLILDQSHT